MAKRNRKVKVNWEYVVYLLRKGISKVGWVSAGAYLVPLLQDGAIHFYTVGGLILALGVGILATLGNERPSPSKHNEGE